MFICIVWGGENLLLFQYKCLPFLSSCKQRWWTAEDNMGFQALMDLCKEKLWLMWNLHGPLDGRKLICLVFVHFTKMAALKKKKKKKLCICYCDANARVLKWKNDLFALCCVHKISGKVKEYPFYGSHSLKVAVTQTCAHS
ncbi:solute carrier family 23 member 3 [Platysternon megacephalum]|uniref:Solute carrier family 23 member 3 n=1 Tax=Platysternon megacephalum TaxID=55544 RepID=A0A4D9DXY8_9SAUR|nr:solute carrier family 23 member 3 [Platysternon megacephalum]